MTTTLHITTTGPVEAAPRSLPHSKLPNNLNADAVAQVYIDKLDSLNEEDIHDEAVWRDVLAFTNTYRTFHRRGHIFAAWEKLFITQQPANFKLKPGSVQKMQLSTFGFVTARFTFETRGELRARSNGVVLLVPTEGKEEWSIWMLVTFLEESDALGNPTVLEKTQASLSNGTLVNETHDELVDVVVVGAGHNGLCMLGRLKALGLKAVALEKHPNAGDSWTTRYDSAKLHLSKWYANMPFGDTFNDNSYPYFLTAEDLSRGFQQFVKEYALDVRTSTEVFSADWDESAKTWTVNANQRGGIYSIKSRHLVFAVGAAQVPNFPQYANREAFKGIAIHSVDYKSPKEWKGQRGVVVGTANTAHDVAEDMVKESLASVTLIQRTPTIVLPWGFIAHTHNKEYNGIADLSESDQNQRGMPTIFSDLVGWLAFSTYASHNPELFKQLERKGFRVKLTSDMMKEIRERSGGHYLDVGCCQKIIDGSITVKGGEIECYTPTGLKFTDGSTLDADVIVWATGFQTNIRQVAEKIVGPKVGALLEDYPRWNEEGEIPGFYRPQKHPAIWYATGEFATARFNSRYLSFFIKADVAGVPFEPYLETP